MYSAHSFIVQYLCRVHPLRLPAFFFFQGMYCKELTLPATELYHTANLVGVLSSGTKEGGLMSNLSVMAVSPEGVVRYWPSLVHDNLVLEMDTDLAGYECHSITAFQV